MRINIRCVADLKEVACSNSGLKTCAAVLRRLSTLSLDSLIHRWQGHSLKS